MCILERLGKARSFDMHPSHPSKMDFARRWAPPTEMAVGYEDGFVAENNFVVTAKHYRMRMNCHESEAGIDRIVFLYHLSGQRKIRVSSGTEITLKKPCFVAYALPEGVSKTSFWKAGGSEVAVGLGFDPSAPPPIVQSVSHDVSFLHDMISGERNCFKWIEFPLDPAVASVARSLVFSDVNAHLLQPYVNAKATELLCLTLDRLINRVTNPIQQISLNDRLTRVKSALEKDLQATFSIEKLSEEFHIPKRELNQAFESAFGVSIREYSTMVRMGRSVFLLAETTTPLKQIAFEVGYGHTSNFCLAFKRRFGETPTNVREHGGKATIQ